MVQVLDSVPFDLKLEALLARIHVSPGSDESGEFATLLAQARQVARPKALYKECYIQAKGPDTVTLDGITFTSRTLRANLEEPQRVFAYVATCGREIDQIPLPDDAFLERYWLDAIKTDLLMAARSFLNAHLDRAYALGKTATMNPGSGDAAVWPIEQQRPLFQLLGNVEQLIGVTLTNSLLMLPNKSISGIRFSTGQDFRTCQLCHRDDCPSRSAPFDPALWAAVGPEAGK